MHAIHDEDWTTMAVNMIFYAKIPLKQRKIPPFPTQLQKRTIGWMMHNLAVINLANEAKMPSQLKRSPAKTLIVVGPQSKVFYNTCYGRGTV